ncbi:MAG: hypothetical protein PW735_05005 [Acidobacteriaceae bacterium]|nr:hypothetical protein [Acidobacteriaceae bacterium]
MHRLQFLLGTVASTMLMLGLSGCGSSSIAGAGSGANRINTPSVSSSYYSDYTESYNVPWVGSPNFSNLTSTLKVHAQVNGGDTESYTVDTGSVGFIVPASQVPNIPSGSPTGSITYSSSGLRLDGVWATVPVTFPDAVNQDGDNVAASSTIPVLAVSTATCTGSGVNSANCTATIPHMMGIGFGRSTTVQTSPVYNVALNLDEMAAGTMRRGYMIKRDGLDLGLTSSNVGNSFGTQQLTSAGTPAAGTHNDWVTPSGGVIVGSGASELTGTVLLDTGLLDMIVEDSTLPQSGTVDSGTQLTIYIGSHDYVITVGGSSGATPTSVNYASASHGTFVNTGLRALYHYDVLFDADDGLYGLWYIQ